MDQSQENGQGVAGSTPGGDLHPTRRTKNFLKNQPDFSRTSGFRGEFTESLNFHFPPWKVTINDFIFRQNQLKVEKPLKMAVFGTVS